MRIRYPNEVKKTLEDCKPYLVYSKGVGMIFKEDTPEELKERYLEAQKQIRELKQAAL